MYSAAAGDFGIMDRRHNEREILLTWSTTGRSDAYDAGVCSADRGNGKKCNE